MSKSSYLGANVEVDSDTFTSFVNKVNMVIADMGTAVVTAAPVAQANSTNGASTTGNAHIEGVLSAVTVVAPELRGGTMSVSNTMTISSNVNPKANTTINLGADASRYSNVFVINTNTRTLFANTANVVSATITTGNVGTLTANNATITNANATVVNAGDIVISGNLTVQGVTSLASDQALAVNTSIAETLTVNQVANLNGNTVIGNAASDSLVVNAKVASNVIPSGNTHSLGNTENRFASFWVDTITAAKIASTMVPATSNTYALGNTTSKFSTLYVNTIENGGGVLAVTNATANGLTINGSIVWNAGNDGELSGLDADLLEGQHGAFYRDASNLNAGTIADARLPTSMAGKTFTSEVTGTTLRLTSTTDASETSTGHALQIGDTASQNLIIDNNEIMVRTNGVLNSLFIPGGVTFNGDKFLAISDGGTGANTATDARTALGLAAIANTASASDLSTGTIADARLPTSMAGKTFTTKVTVTGNEIEVSGSSPRIYLKDTTSAAHDFWLHVDAGFFSIQRDTNDDGTWESPPAFQLSNTLEQGFAYGNRILTVADAGSGNGLDADSVDGYHASNLFRDNASFSSTGNLTLFNTGPYLRLQDTTTSAYDARVRLDTNNLYFDGSSDGVNYAEVVRFELDTKLAYFPSTLHITTTSEALRLIGSTSTTDPYISFYQSTTRKAYIQYLDGTSVSQGLRMYNDAATGGDTSLTLLNSGGINSLEYQVNGTEYTVIHTGNLDAQKIARVTATSTSDETDFPIGHSVLLDSATLARNSSVTVRLSSGTGYVNSGTGAILAGTWRSRGFASPDGNDVTMVQRVA